MSYSDFTLKLAIATLGITAFREERLFFDVVPIPPSDRLANDLVDNVSLAAAINTEKARSELIIAPVLLEVKRRNPTIGFFSGVNLNVEPVLGLVGYVDYLLTHSPQQYFIESPICTIVEAKNDNIASGLGQCVAEMVASKLFTKKQNSDSDTSCSILGVVTTGEIWKFLLLQDSTILIDVLDRYISEIDIILGIFKSFLDQIKIASHSSKP